MKYLIISDAGSVHVYNFIRLYLLDKNKDQKIYILRHSINEIPKQYADFYKDNNIEVFTSGPADEGKGKVQTVKRFLRKIRFLKKLGKVDVCHIHYAHRSSCLLYRLFRHNFKKLIISFWGTDILNPSQKDFEQQKKTLRYADKITVTVKHSKEVFQEKFGNTYDQKLQVAHLASETLTNIIDISKKHTKQECRKAFNIPDGKLCLVCGYNADSSQKQDVSLNEISLLPKDLRDKLYVIIPMQYSRTNESYISKVKKSASECGCEYVVLEEYVTFERNAIMSIATDIYLNLRSTDAFSNAMKEQIAAGSLMIQGSWLKYDELDEMNAPVIKIDAMNELHDTLEKVIKTYKFKDEIEIFKPLYDVFNPEHVKGEWKQIFESIGI